jgi:hypothetical protein
MTKSGPLQKFKDHPELLPVFPGRAVKNIAAALERNPDFGLLTITCLRFGGECSSGHEQCRAMRKRYAERLMNSSKSA